MRNIATVWYCLACALVGTYIRMAPLPPPEVELAPIWVPPPKEACVVMYGPYPRPDRPGWYAWDLACPEGVRP